MKENILSWSLANFITVSLMVVLLWVAFGFVGHVFVRAPAKGKATNASAAAASLAGSTVPASV